MNTVQFIETTEERAFMSSTTSFEFREDKKLLWLQKACFFVLSKIGCYRRFETTSFTRHVVNTDSLLENMQNQYYNILDFYDKRGRVILIGPEEYEELTANPDIRHLIRFTCTYNRSQVETMGMNVQVVPWMKGILVVPKDILE